MSYYRFFASDKEMPEYDNADASPVFEGDTMVAIRFNKCSDERTAMRIVKETDYSWAKKFTDKKYVNYIEWYYNDTNAQIIISYIKNLLKHSFSVQLFNTWEGEESLAIARKVNISELTIKDIKKIWGGKFYERNESLIVYKTYENQ